jgi:secreted Zn-dependent insulinase-like peptidase
LTEKGNERVQEVISLIFAHINRLKKEQPRRYIFDEVRTMKEIAFDNKTRKSALSTASSLSTALNFW